MLGKNIKELRVERGLTQSQLAKEIGVSQGAIYFWENEINEPTASYIVALAEFFSVTTDELLAFECSPEKLHKTTGAAQILNCYENMSDDNKKLLLELANNLANK